MHNVQMEDRKCIVTFLASAIYFKSDKGPMIMQGERHCDIIQEIANLGLTKDYKAGHTDGFWCNVHCMNHDTTMFINRENATQIAKRANYPMIGSVLTSEDLW